MAKPRADIEDSAVGYVVRGNTGQQICIDGICNKGKVSTDRSIPVDGRRLARHHLVNELSNHAGVRGISCLARTEDIEVAKTDSLHPVHLAKSLDVVLTGKLLYGIGRERRRAHLLMLWLCRLVPVGRGGSRIHKALHTGVPCCEKHIQGSIDV